VGALLAILLLVTVAATAVLWPLRSRGHLQGRAGSDAARDIASRVKLQELADLDLDYRLGKLADEDYQALRRELRAEAVTLLGHGRAHASPRGASGNGNGKARR
jgi:cytochrome c-type biogenesis protein CcmI